MYKWIKHIVKSYEKMFTVEVPKRPVVYQLGDKKFVKVKRLRTTSKTKGPYLK